MKGVIYARYSSDNQREESIEGQLRECKEYAERNDITILGTYIDRALSAKTDNRPEFQHMIKESAKGLFDVVLVWKLDRFARNRYDSARYKNLLKKNGVKVISARENISEGSEGIILEAMLEGYAEYYSAELSEKVIRGLTDNALKCKYNGGTVPMGYYIDEQQYYQIDPKTAPVVLEMFTKYSEGATMQELVNLLNSRGMRSIRGGKITLNIMNHLLKNRRYMGEYSYRDVVKENGIPAIVPKELFERVQERLAKNKKAPARHKAEDDYLLTTKLYCGKCGSFMVGESGTSHTMKVHRYYRCVNTKKKKLCDKKAVKKDWIEDLVVNYTMKAIMNDEVMERLIDTLMELQKKESTDLPLLKKQLAETEKGINNMLNAIQAGIFTPSTKQRLDELEETKSQLEVSILQEEMHKPLLTREQIAFFIYRFRKFDVTKREQRQRLIDSFVNAVYLYEDKIILTFNYKDGSKTITLAEVEGSDLSVLGAPQKESFNRKVGAFLFVLGRSGLEPFQAPAIRTTKKKASIVRSELFFFVSARTLCPQLNTRISLTIVKSYDRMILYFRLRRDSCEKSLFFITIVCLLSFSLFLFNQNPQDKIIASVSGSDITNREVSSFLKASQLSASFSNSDTSSITNKQTALNYLVEKEIISDLVKENNLSLSEQEVQAIRSSQDETFQLIEDALENGSDTEKMYAQQAMESVEKSAQAYGVSMEEYREMIVDSLVFSAEREKLLSEKFHQNEQELQTYIQDHFEEFDVIIY